MHFEILVEGRSEAFALNVLLKKILSDTDTWRIHPHEGLGAIPQNPNAKSDPKNRTLLHNLPAKLKGYGKSIGSDDVVVVLVDLDRKQDCKAFKRSLVSLLASCDPPPRTLFRIVIEEIEACYLGDTYALKSAYKRLNKNALKTYNQDSQCGTWEKLAEVLSVGPRPRKRSAKSEWARRIPPHMDVENNESPSFRCFRDGLRNLSNSSP